MKKIALLIGLLISLKSYAGGGTVGNGGTGIICRNQQQEITRAQVLDLWEGEILNSLKPLQSTEDYLTLAQKRSLELDDTLIGDPTITEYLTRDFIPNMQFLPQGAHLQLTGDINTVLSPPLGCEYGQIINFTDDNRILVDSEIWEKLDNVNKAALLTHETLYWYLRQNSVTETNSVRTRRAVALMYAGHHLKRPYLTYQQPFLECHNKDNNLESKTNFHIYEMNHQLQIDFYFIEGALGIDRISADLKAPPGEAVSSLEDIFQVTKYSFSGDLKSAIDSQYFFSFERSGTYYTLGIRNVFTNRWTQMELECSPMGKL